MDATNLFKKYPTVNEFYFTTDGIAWWSDADAKRHHKMMGTPEALVECVKRTPDAPVTPIAETPSHVEETIAPPDPG
jgi:hypothetical protein